MDPHPEIFIGGNALETIAEFAFSKSYSQVFVLVDENTMQHCYPKLRQFLPHHQVIEIKSGEENKTLATCELIWKKLTDENADRKILLINLGGGVICDIGGFAAACYKRGIKFLNVPTTLMAMVDAGIGGKTGVDFHNFKNQIGVFADPEAIFIHTGFLETLPPTELFPAFAEVIKHYLIADASDFRDLSEWLLRLSQNEARLTDLDWDTLVEKNIRIKMRIVADDKFENNQRKALNFGHTIGHAVETYFLNKNQKISHGIAIATGILCESWISIAPGEEYAEIVSAIIALNLALPEIKRTDISKIISLIKQDKKNNSGRNQFTLLNSIGNFSVNNYVEERTIRKSLEYYYTLLTTNDSGITSN